MNITIQELGEQINVGVDNIIETVNITIEEVRGLEGKSAYQSYLDTTTDNPPLSEHDWSDNQFMVIETNW